MKKVILLFATLFAVSLVFTSCSDKSENTVVPPMFGYWKCTGIGGNIAGVSINAIPEAYVKYFSIGYAGIGTAGTYVRIGADTDNLSELTSLATSASLDIWKKFLVTGTYTYDLSAGTITHTSDGESKTYRYVVNGNSLKLTEVMVEAPGTVNNVLGILNSLLGTEIGTTAGVEYSYEKMTLADFNNLLPSNQ